MTSTTQRSDPNPGRPSDCLGRDDLWAMLDSMLVIRHFEERTAQSYQQAKIGGFCHLCIGQEAVAVGSIQALRKDDPVITAYRDHGHALARGMDPKYAMAEMFGSIAGCSKGKGGSMHLFDRAHHFYGGHAIVAGQCPLGVGLAFAIRYLKEEKVAVCYLGDGALNQGSFHESMNLAAIWHLPIIFACENNRYSMGTHVARGTSAANDLSRKAGAYDMRFDRCDGMDVLAVYDCFKGQADCVREGGGPAFVEMQTYRYKGHSMSDPQKYRTKEELAEYESRDCILGLGHHLIERKMATQAQIDDLKRAAKARAVDAVKFATDAPQTGPEELYTDVYANPFPPYKKGTLPLMLQESSPNEVAGRR